VTTYLRACTRANRTGSNITITTNQVHRAGFRRPGNKPQPSRNRRWALGPENNLPSACLPGLGVPSPRLLNSRVWPEGTAFRAACRIGGAEPHHALRPLQHPGLKKPLAKFRACPLRSSPWPLLRATRKRASRRLASRPQRGSALQPVPHLSPASAKPGLRRNRIGDREAFCRVARQVSGAIP